MHLRQGMRTLYERLGGYDAIAAIVKEYLGLARTDAGFSRFGTGRGSDTKAKAVQLNIDYVCHMTGGDNYYMGRDMKDAHAGLGITDAEWRTNMKFIESALDKYKVPAQEKSEFLALVERTRRDIVEG